MAENTKIEWAHDTFNPWIGCTKVSRGCDNCYAETLSSRYKWAEWGKGKPRKKTSPGNWMKPEQWNRQAQKDGIRRRVFCASLADWLDPEVPDEWREDLLCLIDRTPHLDWLLLTKRIHLFEQLVCKNIGWGQPNMMWPDNIWLGTSAEDQQTWDKRVPVLMQIKAKVHFVSAEPLLGPIVMGETRPEWLIVGGESGHGARAMQIGWVRSLREQCERDNNTAFFFKQWGGVHKKEAGRTLDGDIWSELPSVAA